MTDTNELGHIDQDTELEAADRVEVHPDQLPLPGLPDMGQSPPPEQISLI